MSYNPSLSGANAFCFLTGAKSAGNNNATPDTMEPANTSWVTLPPAATSSMSFSGSVLFRGVVSSSTECMARFGDVLATNSYYEQGNIANIPLISTAGYGAERSDDEMVLYRSGASSIRVESLERFTTQTGPSWESTYPRFFAFRMG